MTARQVPKVGPTPTRQIEPGAPGWLTFVVIAYNEQQRIARTLHSIASQEGIGQAEIIVVDDGSTDGTATIVQELAVTHPRLRLVTLPFNTGRGNARARGVSEAGGALVAFVDADVVLPPDWLGRCLAALDDEQIAAVGGTAVPDGDIAYLAGRSRLTPRRVPHATTVSGSNGLFRAGVFARLDFDPELREGEDVAFGHAVAAAGLQTATVPDLVVKHLEGKNLLTSLGWMFQSGRGASRQLRTFRRVRRPDLVFGGWLLCQLTALELLRRGRPGLAVGAPVVFTATAAAAHVRSRFVTQAEPVSRVVAASGLDAVLLTMYFVGRLTGLFSGRRASAHPRTKARMRRA